MKDETIKARKFTDLLEEHHVDEVLDGEVIDEISLAEILPNPYQPRKIFDQEKIKELTNSIKEHGVFQPIILKKTKQGYVIVSGERRYRAAKLANLDKIPAIIRQYEDSKIAEIALAENLQREDLNPMEEAEAYRIMMDKLNLTQEEMSKRVGKSRSHVTNIIGLLALDPMIKNLLLENRISMGHARALSKIKSADVAKKIALRTVANQLSVREVEAIVKNEEKRRNITRKKVDNIYEETQVKLSEFFGVKTTIKDKKIIIHANEKIEDIISRLLK